MKVKFDRENDALYLRLADAKVLESEKVAPGVIVDFDVRNRVVGVEVLDVSRRVPAVAERKRRLPAAPQAVLVREKSAKYGKRAS